MKVTDQDIREALLRKGWIIPTTEREVAIVEALFPESELPEHLKTPPIALLRREIEQAAGNDKATDGTHQTNGKTFPCDTSHTKTDSPD